MADSLARATVALLRRTQDAVEQQRRELAMAHAARRTATAASHRHESGKVVTLLPRVEEKVMRSARNQHRLGGRASSSSNEIGHRSKHTQPPHKKKAIARALRHNVFATLSKVCTVNIRQI